MSQLADLQSAISKTRAERGFVTDPVKLQVLLTEEVGEIAAEIKKLWSVNYDDFDRDRLQEEIAGCIRTARGFGNPVRHRHRRGFDN